MNLLFGLLLPTVTFGWVAVDTSVCKVSQRTSLSVASKEASEIETATDKHDNEVVPYVIARGDGSTGGGGLPMPNIDESDGLARPKVGAEMPLG